MATDGHSHVIVPANEPGLEPFGSSSEEMTEIVKRDVPRFAQAVKSIGIEPE